MKFHFILLVLITAGLLSCKESANSGKCTIPSGKYINNTVLKGCPDKMPYDIPNYSYELVFNGKDSVAVDNGFEHYTLPFTSTDNKCEFVISKASAEGDMLFRVTSDSTIELIDTAWTRATATSIFGKVNTSAQQSWGFKELLNDCLITGSYAFFIEGELQPNQVTFLVNGQLNGMKPFIGYSLCYAGDCVGETEPPSRTIDLLDMEGHVQTFSFKNVEGKMAIELYEIGESKPDIKGERPIGKLKYEFRTE